MTTTKKKNKKEHTMSDPFATPAAPSGGIDLKDHLGALLLFTVHSVEEGIQTVHGASSAIRCDVAVLDGANKGDEHADTLIFPKVLQSQLRKAVGQKVLGRLGQGQAKPGQSAPWILTDPTDEDRKAGVEYLSNGFAAPAASAPF